jgi:UMF1 family MFS transporter
LTGPVSHFIHQFDVYFGPYFAAVAAAEYYLSSGLDIDTANARVGTVGGQTVAGLIIAFSAVSLGPC